MSYHQCCCSPMTSCCDWWDCPIAIPTTITFTFSGVRTRYYDTGESVVLSEYTWTIVNTTAFAQHGVACDHGLGYWIGCSTALVTWEYIERTPFRDHTSDDSSTDGIVGTIPDDGCSGCDFNSGDPPTCDYTGTVCAYEQRWWGSQTVTHTDEVIRYECANACGCIRPMLTYSPPTIYELTGQYEATQTCDCDQGPLIDPEAAAWLMPGFSVYGACGCPSESTWDAPTHVGGGIGITANPLVLCASAVECDAVNRDITESKGSDTFTWSCTDYSVEPPAYVECSRTITWYDRCVSTLTITVV